VYLTPVFLGSVAFVFLNFSLPIYTRGLGADAVEIGGMYTVFTLTMLVFRPVVGWALDRYGRRWFFTFAFLFYAIAMFAFSNAGSLIDFYVARFLQGIGASLMWVAARTIVADLTTDGDRGRKMGRLSSVSVQGSMMGAFYGFTLMSMFPLPEAWRLAVGVCRLCGGRTRWLCVVDPAFQGNGAATGRASAGIVPGHTGAPPATAVGHCSVVQFCQRVDRADLSHLPAG
jgi:MFS family permease